MDISRSIRTFYDSHNAQPTAHGPNQRHISIRNWLRRFGIQPHHSVLEIGCGPGITTKLIAAEVSAGRVVAVDISPRRIESAKELNRGASNIEFLAADISDFASSELFDLIVLPDVLEHIPLEQHNTLFKSISCRLKPGGSVIIHIPEPKYLEYLIRHHPDKLQIIDQPIHLELLTDALKDTNLRVVFLQSYSLWTATPDYQIIRLVRTDAPSNYHSSSSPTGQADAHLRLIRKLAARLLRLWR